MDKVPDHEVIALQGRFKGDKRKRCHILPLVSKNRSGITIIGIVGLLLTSKEEIISVKKIGCLYTSLEKICHLDI